MSESSSGPRFQEKIIAPEVLAAQLAQGRWPRPLVFTNWVFDILNRGNVSFLDEAAQLGASLFVGVYTDASVRRLIKGAYCPFKPLNDRLVLLTDLLNT